MLKISIGDGSHSILGNILEIATDIIGCTLMMLNDNAFIFILGYLLIKISIEFGRD